MTDLTALLESNKGHKKKCICVLCEVVDGLRKLMAENERYREALEWYTCDGSMVEQATKMFDEGIHSGSAYGEALINYGEKAREALAASEKETK